MIFPRIAGAKPAKSGDKKLWSFFILLMEGKGRVGVLEAVASVERLCYRDGGTE